MNKPMNKFTDGSYLGIRVIAMDSTFKPALEPSYS